MGVQLDIDVCVHLVAEAYGQQLRSADGDPTASVVHGSEWCRRFFDVGALGSPSW